MVYFFQKRSLLLPNFGNDISEYVCTSRCRSSSSEGGDNYGSQKESRKEVRQESRQEEEGQEVEEVVLRKIRTARRGSSFCEKIKARPQAAER